MFLWSIFHSKMLNYQGILPSHAMTSKPQVSKAILDIPRPSQIWFCGIRMPEEGVFQHPVKTTNNIKQYKGCHSHGDTPNSWMGGWKTGEPYEEKDEKWWPTWPIRVGFQEDKRPNVVHRCSPTRWCPSSLAKLVYNYNSNFTRIYGRDIFIYMIYL